MYQSELEHQKSRLTSANSIQGRHGWQGSQGLGLAWILQNRKQQWQRRNDTDEACLPKIGRGGPVLQIRILTIT